MVVVEVVVVVREVVMVVVVVREVVMVVVVVVVVREVVMVVVDDEVVGGVIRCMCVGSVGGPSCVLMLWRLSLKAPLVIHHYGGV